MAVGFAHALRIVEPDYEIAQTLISDSWAEGMDGFTVGKGVGLILVDEGSCQPGDEVILNRDTVARACELPILSR